MENSGRQGLGPIFRGVPGPGAPATGQLQAQTAAHADQHDAEDAGVAVALGKNVKTQHTSEPEARQRTADKADSVRQSLNQQLVVHVPGPSAFVVPAGARRLHIAARCEPAL